MASIIKNHDTKTLQSKQNDKPKHNISIWLDSYDDIFSDFDSRELSERNISDDFIDEIRKQYSENEIQVQEIKLIIDLPMRNSEIEKVITNRLHNFFKNNNVRLQGEWLRSRKMGAVILLCGFALLLVAGYISKFQSGNFFVRILFVITEPSGWYFAWTGLEKLFSAFSGTSITLLFFQSLAKAKVVFSSPGS
ncbi:MAG: hypothetical protein ACK452_11570 [Bacteroidota bacterium]